MKRNGYTVYDILIIIVILGISALIVIPRVSNALKEYDNKDEVYNEIMADYLKLAEMYGNDNKEKIKEESNTVVSIDDLIKEGYIVSSTEEIIDIRDNYTKMNNIKIKLIYNEDEDKVIAELS
ncbi:MAG: hypothetical protein IJ572_00925 [Bacilli bacterium]|nr:hypothetical protein [Bacilli bacterium]